MQKIILDTNILVSALIQQGYPRSILQLYNKRKIELCISNDILAEYHDVLNRPKFSKFRNFRENADQLLADISKHAHHFRPTKKIRKIKDKDDDMLLELALKCKANFIITGNTTDFTFSKFRKTQIVTPREYWENYKPE